MGNLQSRAAAALNRALTPLDLELTRRSRSRRTRLEGVLEHLARRGLAPKTVLDVGAAYGDWSRASRVAFPRAHHFLVEPLSEFAPFLTREAAAAPEHVTYVSAAAAPLDGPVTLNVHEDLVGSSILRESEGSGTDGTARAVTGITLDHLVDRHAASGPYLVKVDAQGAELEILTGAQRVLAESEVVVLETSLFEFLYGGPDLNQVMKFMRDAGFAPYDIWGLLYRPLDGALAQVDVAFVRDGGFLRTDHRYAAPEQRRHQDEQLRALYRRRKNALGRKQR